MPELLWYALSHGVTRPVPGQDVPLWFAGLLILGLLCAGALIGSGLIQLVRNLYKKRVRLLRVRGQAKNRSGPTHRGTGGTGAAAA